ncbi:MAG: stilbene synthase [Verrucomicrobia bacterium]|nr:stilbene synthase [Verrucomicrobiota bacterium]
MYLQALTTAVPSARYTQQECWQMIAASPVRPLLARRSVLVLQSILNGDSGIASRHFAATPLEQVFTAPADTLNEIFRREAPLLAGRALATALAQAGLHADQLDALIVCTCTGYLCPGVSSYVAEQLGLRPNAYLQDLVGLGCGAAIPTLRSAQGVLAAHPGATVACIAVEICSAAFYLDDDQGVLISSCLFGDGASASIWRATPPKIGPYAAAPLMIGGFDTHHDPAARDQIRFEQRDGKLRNRLTAAVPALAAAAVARLLATETAARGTPARILAHPGGRDVLDALEAALPGHRLTSSRRVLRDYGNMSSPSVLFALADALAEGPPDSAADCWLVAFGAGFSAHSCRLTRA